jgi:pyrroloquinoline quinone biosynthesis protein E
MVGAMEIGYPYALTAELTHRCPLRCVYCSNPLELKRREDELTTADWMSVLAQAGELGVAQVHFTGGEPLARPDLEALIRAARDAGMFVNVITSGVGMTERRARQLADAGVDSVQLSIQASAPELSDFIAGTRAFERKRQAAAWIREAGIPLQMNAVLHRLNLQQIEELIGLCASWGAQRLELANAQYYGWALRNRSLLLPSSEDLRDAEAAYRRARERFGRLMEIIWVVPDYYEEYPKPCMGGWARWSMAVAPDGSVLPCTAASGIRTLRFENVKLRDLAWIWRESPSFQAFRGTDWMPEPCRSCERKELDFGGCRCQAYELTGDAAQTDPVCRLSPHRRLVEDAVHVTAGRAAGGHAFAWRAAGEYL